MAPTSLMTLTILLLVVAQTATASRRITGTGTGTGTVSIGTRASARFKAEVERMRKEREEAELAGRNMSVGAALQRLRGSNNTPQGLMALLSEHMNPDGSARAPHLRKGTGLVQGAYKPSNSIQKARDMLNQMIEEAITNKDKENTECEIFFNRQCSLMETCRQDIASANSEAAGWRSKILLSQKEINICEFNLPRVKNELEQHNKECKSRLHYLNASLQVVLNDISVMESVLKLTECDEEPKGSTFIQLPSAGILQCEERCNKTTYMTFGHQTLKDKLALLRSSKVKQLIQRGLKELTAENEVEPGTEGLNFTGANVTEWDNPPLPQFEIPADPCAGIEYDNGEGKGGCSLRSNPQCMNLANKFINIQGEVVDAHDELVEEIDGTERACKEARETMEEEISRYEGRHDSGNTLLAESTSGENDAAEDGKEKSTEHDELAKQMFDTREACSTKLRNYESELCALKKIRGELFKLKGDKYPFFQDCEVSEEWDAEECSKNCGGGVQLLRRSIVAPNQGGGAACPPTLQQRLCNEHPCPIDCKTSVWSGWSACSAECGGGVRERMRSITVKVKYDGEPCGALYETEPCNMQACDKDCKLSHWTAWTECSRACDGGEKTRIRTIKEPAIGRGKCAEELSRERFQKTKCNLDECPHPVNQVIKCTSTVDLVLLLDGSFSVKADGWKKTIQFATKFVEAFDGNNTDTQVSIILFSGPRNWYHYKICNSALASTVDKEKVCGIKMVQHFSKDMKTTKENIKKLKWPKSTTYTAGALETARAELMLGRNNATKVVLTVTDGIPISPALTRKASKQLKESARMMFAPVNLNEQGMKYIMQWASAPTKDNVLQIEDFDTLSKTITMNAIVRDMCLSVA